MTDPHLFGARKSRDCWGSTGEGRMEPSSRVHMGVQITPCSHVTEPGDPPLILGTETDLGAEREKLA